MSSGDVTAHPLVVNFSLHPKTETDAAKNNSQYAGKGVILPLSQVMALLSPSDKATAQAALGSLLTTPLGASFNSAWASAKASQAGTAAAFITSAAASNGFSISDVAVNLPDTGTVTALVEPADTPGGPGKLFLSFLVTGCSASFDYLAPANWLDSFDISVTLATPVPLRPFGFAPTMSAQGSNAVFGPNNVLAGIFVGLDDALTWLGNLFSQSNHVSDADAAEQAIEQMTDSAIPTPVNSALATMLTKVNAFGPVAIAIGFTQFMFTIENGDTLTGTLTHPLDPGPLVQNSLAPVGGLDLNLAKLSAGQTVVAPDETFTVEGHQFPPATSGQLSLLWGNTTSGTAVQAQLAVTGGGSSHTYTVPVGPYSDEGVAQYDYTVTGLKPGTQYTFMARCADQFTWSLWTQPPLTLTTSGSDLVSLMLKSSDAAAVATLLGSSDLAPNSSDWACNAHIPKGTASGNYTLIAMLGLDILASMPIAVGTVSTNIAVIENPLNQQVILEPVAFPGGTLTIRGQDFPDGPVTLTLAGKPAGTGTAVNGSFIHTLISNEPSNFTATYTITATGGGATATTTYTQIAPPK